MTPATLMGLAALGFGWVTVRASSAIIGEYAKRLWFRKLWVDELVRGRAELAALKASIEAERAEYRWAVACTQNLLRDNDRLLLELIQARAGAQRLPSALDREPEREGAGPTP